MHFVLAQMSHETNTFSPLPTPLNAFSPGMGGTEPALNTADAIAALAGTNTPLAAFYDLACEAGATVEIPIAGAAAPSGPVDDAAFETFCTVICKAVEKGCDALFLDLHGAMVTQTYDDGEGELLRRVRHIAPNLPIAVALDFHTNMSQTMVDNATVITGFRTYPHIDMYETGQRAGRTLLRALRGEIKPVMSICKQPMLTHTLKQTPAEQPMKDIMDQAIQAEASGQVLNASVFGGFPMADIPHVGLTALIVSDGDPAPGAALAQQLCDLAWQRRADFVYQVEPVTESIATAKTFDTKPVVLVDHGDNVFSGGSQDVMATVAEAIAQGLENMAVGPIWDPASVEQMIAAGVGAEITLQLGGKTPLPALGLTGEPLTISGRVRCITDGRYRVTCPMLTGVMLDHGRSAVLDTGTMEILVCSKRMEAFDLGVFRHAGIEPTAKHYLLIKSRQHFRAGFAPIAKHIVLLSGPGATSSDYSLFNFQHVPRPLYPLDWNE